MALVIRPLIVLLLQPWSTATSQTRKKKTVRAAKPLIHNDDSETSVASWSFGGKDAGHLRT